MGEISDHALRGILLDEADRAPSACIRGATGDCYPRVAHAKADADVVWPARTSSRASAP
jgi:hypothetical protein